jgi:hypothetical protein
VNIPPRGISGRDIGFKSYGFYDEPDRSARIPRPPAIAFRIVSKVAVASAGIELRQSHCVASQIEDRLQRPPRDHLARFVQLKSHNLKAHDLPPLDSGPRHSPMPITTLC